MLRGAVLLQCSCISVMLYFDVPQKLFFLNLVTPDLSYHISFYLIATRLNKHVCSKQNVKNSANYFNFQALQE